jgi:hypothetical protein
MALTIFIGPGYGAGMKLRVCAPWLPEGSAIVEGVDVQGWSIAQLKQALRSQVPGAPPEQRQRLVSCSLKRLLGFSTFS